MDQAPKIILNHLQRYPVLGVTWRDLQDGLQLRCAGQELLTAPTDDLADTYAKLHEWLYGEPGQPPAREERAGDGWPAAARPAGSSQAAGRGE